MVSMAYLVTIGVARSGEWRVLGLELAAGNVEGKVWTGFERAVLERALVGVRLVTSDDDTGFVKAVRLQPLRAAWQRDCGGARSPVQAELPRAGGDRPAAAPERVQFHPGPQSGKPSLLRWSHEPP